MLGVLRVTIARSKFIGLPADNATTTILVIIRDPPRGYILISSRRLPDNRATNETYASTTLMSSSVALISVRDAGQRNEDGTNGESDGDENEDELPRL